MNRGEHKKGGEGFELTPLTADQHPVSRLPKLTADLPQFWLTKQPQLLAQDIHYEGTDSFGNPILWEVMPNRSKKIGVPSIEAHQVFHRLIKPMMDVYLVREGSIPEIIPLGRIRECLR